MSDYPRDLLIKENIIRDVEDAIGIRIVNKSKSAEALKQHDAEIRRQTIDEVKEVVKNRLIDNLGLENATKYGNKTAKQQINSYATVMKYEIADCVEDLIDDLEQMKGETE